MSLGEPRAAGAEAAPALPVRGVAAHRGGPAHAPENTLAAFREAVRLGAHQIELDVRVTADGELVVIHDESVDRCSDGHGRVAELSLAQLRRLDFGSHGSPAFRGELIPTLEEALGVMPRDVWINVQIKYGEPLGALVAGTIARADRLHQTFLACGNSAVESARAREPGILVCNLVRQRTRADYVAHARATGSDFIQLHHARGLPEPDLVRRCRDAGIRVNFFCDPENECLEEVYAAGVDFALVDDVTRGLGVASRFGVLPHGRA